MAKLLNEISNMPEIQSAITPWEDTIKIGIVTQTWNEGDLTQSISQVSFKGTIQPLSAKQIALKPEGQRAWTWYMIHCTKLDLNIDVNDKIYIDDIKYKVMAYNNYKRNGYVEFHIVKDYD